MIDGGAYIHVVNRQNEHVEAGYEYYSGPTREVLKFVENIKNQSGFRIDWNKSHEHVYIEENALHLRACTSLPGFDPDFIEAHDISQAVSVNDLEKKIMVSEVQKVVKRLETFGFFIHHLFAASKQTALDGYGGNGLING